MTTPDLVKPAVNDSRERGEPVPPEMLLGVARQVKEQHSYLASDIVKVNTIHVPLLFSAFDARVLHSDSKRCSLQEFGRHDEQPEKYVKAYRGTNPKTGTEFCCDVAHERFLGPEVFFNPEIYSSEYTTPLPQVSVMAIGSIRYKHSLVTSFLQLNGDVLQVVDNVISSCPIDTRRALYGNIVLSVSFAVDVSDAHALCRLRLNRNDL